MRVVEQLDRPAQGERDLPPDGGKLGAGRTAELAGTSVRQVERARRIRDSGDEQVKQAVRNGELTLPAAERTISEKTEINARTEEPRDPEATVERAEEVQRLEIFQDVGDVAHHARETLRHLVDTDPDRLSMIRERLDHAIEVLGWLADDALGEWEELSQPSVDSD